MTSPTPSSLLNSPSHSALHDITLGSDRVSASIAVSVAAGGVDVDWTGVVPDENTGASFDFAGTTINDAVPTIRTLVSGVYAVMFQTVVTNPQDATFISYVVSDPATIGTPGWLLTSPLNAAVSVPAWNICLPYLYPAHGSFTIQVNHDASSPVDVTAIVRAIRIS